ncbi:unnamed protein product [Ciceribacter sp. T2.26MG-112.2]|nr:unnamed protein product [Ciceribacter naphthalenivorans]
MSAIGSQRIPSLFRIIDGHVCGHAGSRFLLPEHMAATTESLMRGRFRSHTPHSIFHMYQPVGFVLDLGQYWLSGRRACGSAA